MINRLLPLAALPVMLVGCAKPTPMTVDLQGYVHPNHVITKVQSAKLPKETVHASYGMGNDPAVVKAYQHYVKSGRMQSINREGFKTLAYEANSHPIVACEPLHLCVVQLEKGERINDIAMGDSVNWLVSTALIGEADNGTLQIVIKPKTEGVATDMVVATSRRTYNIGLVSQQGQATRVVNFYYPRETLQAAIAQSHVLASRPIVHEQVTQSTHLAVDHLHFDYDINGTAPWKPQRVFDDGDKTFIEMPPIASRLDLPVLYLQQHGKQHLVNYRYKKPYYIVDSLFETGILVTGHGRLQTKVVIRNRHLA